jgi:hypothetical protein
MTTSFPRCGSSKIISKVPLLDHYGDVGIFSSEACVEVHDQPGAWIFKDTITGKLTADICGECGHADLRVSNFRELYEKHRLSGSGGRPSRNAAHVSDVLVPGELAILHLRLTGLTRGELHFPGDA